MDPQDGWLTKLTKPARPAAPPPPPTAHAVPPPVPPPAQSSLSRSSSSGSGGLHWTRNRDDIDEGEEDEEQPLLFRISARTARPKTTPKRIDEEDEDQDEDEDEEEEEKRPPAATTPRSTAVEAIESDDEDEQEAERRRAKKRQTPVWRPPNGRKRRASAQKQRIDQPPLQPPSPLAPTRISIGKPVKLATTPQQYALDDADAPREDIDDDEDEEVSEKEEEPDGFASGSQRPLAAAAAATTTVDAIMEPPRSPPRAKVNADSELLDDAPPAGTWMIGDANPIRRALYTPHAAQSTPGGGGRSSWLKSMNPGSASSSQSSPAKPQRFVAGGLRERYNRITRGLCIPSVQIRAIIVLEHEPAHQAKFFCSTCWIQPHPDVPLSGSLCDVFFQDSFPGEPRVAVNLLQWKELHLVDSPRRVILCSKRSQPEIARPEEVEAVPLLGVDKTTALVVTPHVPPRLAPDIVEPSYDPCPAKTANTVVGIIQRVTLHQARRPEERRASLLLWTATGKVREIVIPEAFAQCCYPLILDGIGRCWSFSGLRGLEVRFADAAEQEVLRRYGSSASVIRLEATDLFCATPSKLWRDAVCTYSPPPLLTIQSATGSEARAPPRISLVASVGHVTEESLWLVDRSLASARVAIVGHLSKSLVSECCVVPGDVLILRDVRFVAHCFQFDRWTTVEKVVHGAEDAAVSCQNGWVIVHRGAEMIPGEPRGDNFLDSAMAVAREMLDSSPVPSFSWTFSRFDHLAAVSGRIISTEDRGSAVVCDSCLKPMDAFTREETQLLVCRRCAKLSGHGEKQVAIVLERPTDQGAATAGRVDSVRVLVNSAEVLQRVMLMARPDQGPGGGGNPIGQLVAGLLCVFSPESEGAMHGEVIGVIC